MSIGILALALLLGSVILAFWLRGRGHRPPMTRAVALTAAPLPPSAPGAYPGWDIDDDATLAYEEPAVSGTARDLAKAGPVRYTRRLSGPGRTGRGRRRGCERSGTGLMGLDALAAVARDPVGRLG